MHFDDPKSSNIPLSLPIAYWTGYLSAIYDRHSSLHSDGMDIFHDSILSGAYFTSHLEKENEHLCIGLIPRMEEVEDRS